MTLLVKTDCPATFGNFAPTNHETPAAVLRLNLGSGSMDRPRNLTTIVAMGNMESHPDPIPAERHSGSAEGPYDEIPNLVTIKAMNEARDGKNIARFPSAEALFDDLGI